LHCTSSQSGTVIKFKQMMLLIPYLAEQKRIVEKLEQLLTLCERLK
jgi:restriction endonuclease S subunit